LLRRKETTALLMGREVNNLNKHSTRWDEPQQYSGGRGYSYARNMNECLTLLEIIPLLGENWGSLKYPFVFVNVHFVLKQFLKKIYLFKTMIFSQLKHAKHLLNRNK
jgi:hypothetical protein